mmetsp:Transcript_133/g.1025  ORF Transcript_133/g.1025 Transcript_133/m.1025 type:complete len:140 (+) Transcript_133:8532-8951(+)
MIRAFNHSVHKECTPSQTSRPTARERVRLKETEALTSEAQAPPTSMREFSRDIIVGLSSQASSGGCGGACIANWTKSADLIVGGNAKRALATEDLGEPPLASSSSLHACTSPNDAMASKALPIPFGLLHKSQKATKAIG